MNTLRARIELFFETLVHTTFRYRWIVLFVILTSTFLLIMQIRHLKIDTSTQALFYKDDPEIVQYDQFRKQFGSTEVAIVATQTPNVFSIAFLQKLWAFHDNLEKNVPNLDNITSLVNVTALLADLFPAPALMAFFFASSPEKPHGEFIIFKGGIIG